MQLNQTISLNGPSGEELSAQIMPGGRVLVAADDALYIPAADLRAWCEAVLKVLADAS